MKRPATRVGSVSRRPTAGQGAIARFGRSSSRLQTSSAVAHDRLPGMDQASFLRTHGSPWALCLGAVSLGAALLWPGLVEARSGEEAIRLGAFSGAMRFCEERYGGTERRYRLARLRVAGAVDDMASRDKFKALAARDRAYERGQFIGNPLDDRECRALLRMSEWKAWVD